MNCRILIEGRICENSQEHPITSQTYPISTFILSIKFVRRRELYSRECAYRNDIPCRYKIKMKTLCGYLHEKLRHCTIGTILSTDTAYVVRVSCNYEWLVSVIDTEMDYHLGRKRCTKKYNERYMREYTATQLSGFGEKFYDPVLNISQSIIGQLYKMEVPNGTNASVRPH